MIYIVVCPFVLLFCLVIELSVILRYTASNYPLWYFQILHITYQIQKHVPY